MSAINWVPRTLIVPMSHVEFAQDLCAIVAGPSGFSMFTSAIGSNGVETHRINGLGLIDEQFAFLLPLTYFPELNNPVHTSGKPDIVSAIACAKGMEVTAEQVQELFNASDITNQDGYAAMQRLGLSFITKELDI